jgi:hypothetical protein
MIRKFQLHRQLINKQYYKVNSGNEHIKTQRSKNASLCFKAGIIE